MTLPATSRVPRLFWVVLFIAVVARGGFLVKNWNNLDFAGSYVLHAEVARNILNGNWFQLNQPYLQTYLEQCHRQGRLIDPADFPPPEREELTPLYNDEGGYGMLLAVLWKITGSHRWWSVRAIQVLLDLLMCWLVFRIGCRLFDERAGLLGSLLYAVFIPGIELVVRPHRDIWVTFLFIFSVYQLLRLPEGGRPLLKILTIGIATGIVAWMRSTVLLFVFLMIPVLFVRMNRNDALRFSLALLAGFLISFAPLIVRNYVVFDKFMATRGVFWHSFWAGVGQMPNPYNLQDDDETIIRFAKSLDSTAQYDTDHYEQVLKAEAYRFIGEHPAWYAGSIVKRAAVFLAPKVGRELFFQPTLPRHVTGSLNLGVSRILLISVDGCFALLFLGGIWVARNRWKDVAVLCYPYFYTMITLAPFYLVGRNIMNVYFAVLICAAGMLVVLWDRLKNRRPDVV